jgi:hypothetical protein
MIWSFIQPLEVLIIRQRRLEAQHASSAIFQTIPINSDSLLLALEQPQSEIAFESTVSTTGFICYPS